MSPETAKTKWCPYSGNRVIQSAKDGDPHIIAMAGPPHNEVKVTPFCLADGCAAWRWEGPRENGEGYCGLAGRP